MKACKYRVVLNPLENCMFLFIRGNEWERYNAEYLAELVEKDKPKRAKQTTFFGSCPNCDAPLNDSDAYCCKCGQRIGEKNE